MGSSIGNDVGGSVGLPVCGEAADPVERINEGRKKGRWGQELDVKQNKNILNNLLTSMWGQSVTYSVIS